MTWGFVEAFGWYISIPLGYRNVYLVFIFPMLKNLLSLPVICLLIRLKELQIKFSSSHHRNKSKCHFFVWYASLLQKHASPCRAQKLIGVMSQSYVPEASHSCQLLNMCLTDDLLASLVHHSMKTILVRI